MTIRQYKINKNLFRGENMKISKTLKGILDSMNRPHVEPFTVERLNRKTGKIEHGHMVPTSVDGYYTFLPCMH